MRKTTKTIVSVIGALNLGLAFGATWTVPTDYPTIQAAIVASVSGDTIVVKPGAYKENLNYLGKAITITSERGPRVTTIDGAQQGSVVTFKRGETAEAVLNGFTIENGVGVDDGGGVLCRNASPTITNNIITANTVSSVWGAGGGIGLITSNAFIAGNTIHGNTTMYCGGGINCGYTSAPTIADNTIYDNSSGWGGGISSRDSTPLITGNRISGNMATAGCGLNFWSSAGTTSGNLITQNPADHQGGGILCGEASDPIIVNNIIAGNTAGWGGGGINCEMGSNPQIVNNSISGNNGNPGGGLCCSDSAPVVVNTILWDNLPDEIALTSTSTPTVSFCDVEGGWTGTGNIDADPLFFHAYVYDLHLTFGSPCRDAGANQAPGLPVTDFEGDPRSVPGITDIGADEFHTHLYHVGDVTPGGTIDIRVVGQPGANPVRLLLAAGTQDPPQSTPWGDLYLNQPFVSFGIGAIPAFGILAVPMTVPASWAPGSQHPAQALNGPIAPGSKLTNLMLLTVE